MSGNIRKLDSNSISNTSKMRIKAFPISMSDQSVTKIWESLKRAIVEIQKKNNSGLSFEELYRNAYTMVLQKNGELLYSGTRAVVTEHMLAIRDEVAGAISNNLLMCLNRCWKEHITSMVMIRDILMYMDRVYVAQTDKPNVYNIGMIIFRETVLRYEPIQRHLRSTLLDMVKRERNGEVISRSQLRDACQMLVQLGVDKHNIYEEDFESHFLDQSREYYRAESEKLLTNNPANIYINNINRIIDEEAKRARDFLHISTETKIVQVVNEELIKNHLQTIVNADNSGLTHMLINKKYNEIGLMYNLLKRVDNGANTMSACISRFLRDEGKKIVSDDKTPQVYIQELISLRDRVSDLLSAAFLNNQLFRNQINSDFEFFINLNLRSPEYLSLYIDDKLKRGTKGISDQDIDAIFDRCIILFRYLQDKDIFERYYKQHLAKRLLMSKSQSDDQEKSMISKLLIECGGVFTSKLEGMFKDMAVSKTLMEDFSSQHFANDTCLDLYVRVLTTGLWPTQIAIQSVCLPEEALNAFNIYKNFYLHKHTGRVIHVQPNLGYVELSAYFMQSQLINNSGLTAAFTPEHFGESESIGYLDNYKVGDNTALCQQFPGLSTACNRKYILQVSTYQMIVLMRFNHKLKYTFQELLEETKIPERDLTRCLISLSLSKSTQRILVKEPKNKNMEFTPSDTFSINEAFTSKHIKIKIQSVAVKETEPEVRETKGKIDENRKYVIEATIVRIMKSRKSLAHSLLVAEVIEQLKARFVPTPPMIKQRIESLLERDYLARSDEDKKVYHYLA